ncbi:MAG: hypothetical protein WDA71_03445 [Actinomycetota bacterium]|jgi:hypothetical protein
MSDSERGGIITGWLLRILVGFFIAALLLFDGGSIIITRVQVDGDTENAAREGALAAHEGLDAACEAAKNTVAPVGGTVVEGSCAIDPDGRTFTVTIEKTAKTLFVKHISPLRHFALARASREMPIPP